MSINSIEYYTNDLIKKPILYSYFASKTNIRMILYFDTYTKRIANRPSDRLKSDAGYFANKNLRQNF